MSTFDQRWTNVNRVLNDSEVPRSTKEAWLFLYHAMMFEIQLWRKERALRAAKKHGRILNDQMEVFQFRTDSQNL